MATTNKTASSKTATKTAAKAAAAATPPTVVAKGKRGFAALAEGVPGLRSAKPAAAKKAPAKKRTDAVAVAGQALAKAASKPMRSAAAKRAEPTGVKAATPELPQFVVKNLKGLREAIDKTPKAAGYRTAIKFGIDTIYLTNLRGRDIAEVKLISKAK